MEADRRRTSGAQTWRMSAAVVLFLFAGTVVGESVVVIKKLLQMQVQSGRILTAEANCYDLRKCAY